MKYPFPAFLYCSTKVKRRHTTILYRKKMLIASNFYTKIAVIPCKWHYGDAFSYDFLRLKAFCQLHQIRLVIMLRML